MISKTAVFSFSVCFLLELSDHRIINFAENMVIHFSVYPSSYSTKLKSDPWKIFPENIPCVCESVCVCAYSCVFAPGCPRINLTSF